MNEGRLYTTGEIARQLNIPLNRVDYAIRTYQIEESQRAGIIRLYDSEAVERIKRSVLRISNNSSVQS